MFDCLVHFLLLFTLFLNLLPYALSVEAHKTVQEVCRRFASDWKTTYGDQRFGNVISVSPGADPTLCAEAEVVEEPFLGDAHRRLSFYRWIADLKDVPINSTHQQASQRCALMLAMNGNRNSPWNSPTQDPHTDHSDWKCLTSDASVAAARSNIYFGQSIAGLRYEWQTTPADILHGFVVDISSSKQGHRQSILCPNLARTSFGHACFRDSTTTRHFCGGCQYALDRNTAAMPVSGYVAWPPSGYVPKELVDNYFYWSFAAFASREQQQASRSSAPQVWVNGQVVVAELVQALCTGRGIGQVNADMDAADGSALWWLRFKPSDEHVQQVQINVRVRFPLDAKEWRYTVTRLDCSLVTAAPSPFPTPQPTPFPTPQPTPFPTPVPTPQPTPFPTPLPTPQPTPSPTPVPTTSTTTTSSVTKFTTNTTPSKQTSLFNSITTNKATTIVVTKENVTKSHFPTVSTNDTDVQPGIESNSSDWKSLGSVLNSVFAFTVALFILILVFAIIFVLWRIVRNYRKQQSRSQRSLLLSEFSDDDDNDIEMQTRQGIFERDTEIDARALAAAKAAALFVYSHDAAFFDYSVDAEGRGRVAARTARSFVEHLNAKSDGKREFETLDDHSDEDVDYMTKEAVRAFVYSKVEDNSSMDLQNGHRSHHRHRTGRHRHRHRHEASSDTDASKSE